MTLSPNDIITKNPKIAQRLFEERMLVITAKDSMLHRFNEVGTFVWGLLDKPLSMAEICGSIEEHFDGFETTKSFREIHDFVHDMEKKGLVTIQPEDGRHQSAASDS
jgi:Coenzyme PQQ synthesis protein D (PqqD)